MIGMDTTAIIDLFKGDKNLIKLLEKTKTPVVSTQMNYLELMFGLDISKGDHIREMEYYDELFEEVHTLPLNKEASKKAAKIFWNLKRSGNTIDKFDCIVAGILLSSGIDKIITRNVKHFEKISGIKVLKY